MHRPVMSRADHMVAACTYCMESQVSSLSRIYLYSSYFVIDVLIADTFTLLDWHDIFTLKVMIGDIRVL
jgi:hypothetical protein